MTLIGLKILMFTAIAVVVAVLPRFMGEFRLSQFTFVAIYFVSLLGLNILTGYNGQISLGHGAFMGIGAYVGAMLTLGRPGLEALLLEPPGWLPLGDGMRPIFTIPLAGLITGVIGFLFGLPALRLRGVSLALATFALAVSLPQVAKRFDTVTGGGGGLVLNLPSVPFGWDISVRHWLYYEAWVAAGILFFVAWLLVRGRTGRAWRAIRDGEIAATASGVSPALYKTLAFGVSSFYAGVAGALLAIEVSYVNPDTFPLSLSILLLASVVVGGLGALSGVIFGALLIEFLPIYAQDPPLLPFELSKQSPTVIFGVILILIMFVLPGGVASLIRRATAPIVRNLNRPKRPKPEPQLLPESAER
jgi:branched-chain amino acid transport system permease protein